MRGDQEELKIFLQIRLIASQINQKLNKGEDTSSFKREILPDFCGHLIRLGHGIDGHDHMTIVAHLLAVIVASISRWISLDPGAIGPRSRSNQATIEPRL